MTKDVTRRLTESERQRVILECLPNDGSKIRVSDLCIALRMSPRMVNMHLEALSNINMVMVSYFPGKRAPIRQVWLTTPRENNYPIKNPPPKVNLGGRKKPKAETLSKRRKVKNKVEELIN